MPDAEKRARADFVVDTSGDLRNRAEAALDGIIAELRGRRGEAYRPPLGLTGILEMLEEVTVCAKSFSTPRRPASIPTAATG